VFVLAPARSYSSVVATMIGQHPDLAGLPELKLFTYPTIGALEASLPAYWTERGFTHRSPGLVRALAQFEFGDQSAESLTAARTWLRERAHWPGASVLDVLLTRLAPRMVVEKSPENVATPTALRRLASAYPNARYLHLTRHPVTTQVSMAEHVLRTVPEYPRLGEPVAGIRVWRDMHTRILRFATTLPHDRVMRVRAEDVLNDKRTQLRAIAAWLQLGTDDAAIEAMCRPELSPFARFGLSGSGVIGGHDHGFLSNPIPREVVVPTTIEQPAGWYGEQRLWREVVTLARQFGYDDTSTPMPRRRRPAEVDPGELRVELLRRRGTDRAARAAYAGAPAQMARLMEMDSDNTAWLQTVIEQVGWPGNSLVGEDGAQAAWLLVQHADLKPAFQRQCLELLQRAVEHGDASTTALAYLTDRVLLARGEPQRNGTQVPPHEGVYIPEQLKQPDTVNVHPAGVGFAPIAHLGLARGGYASRQSARQACPGCGQPFDVRLPVPGETTRFKCPACGATGTVRAKLRPAQPPA
jgi:hypothetical protein